MESRHVSPYCAFRRGKRHTLSRWPKLTATCDDLTHLFLSAKLSRGPGRDTCEAPSLLRSTGRRVRLRRVLWDAGCDAEGIHKLIRQELKAHSLIPAKSGRPTRRWPRTRYRRQMRRRFLRKVYGQRWQMERVFSRYKRRRGSALTATGWMGQKREAYLRVLTYNLMLLRCAA